MKVLLQSRSTLFKVPGGDTIQIKKTREYLEKAGITVDISMELEPDVSSYDIVHLFNLVRPQELYIQAINAKRQNKKVVLSTIYVSYAEYEKKARGGMVGFVASMLKPSQIEYVKVGARAVKNREFDKGTGVLILRGYRSLQKKILAMTDILLPNSDSEMRRLIQDIPAAAEKKYVIVPNAVDKQLFAGRSSTLPSALGQYRGCILCVARIEGLKNQLNLVRAVRGLPWPLVLIGKVAPNHQKYLEQVRQAAGPNVHLLGEIEHSRLPQFYSAAMVHVLPSWMETTGLSSLEAASMGCKIVITDKGDARDYFGTLAHYCEPDSVESIKATILKAYETPVDPQLQRIIFQNYTWEKTAEKTLQGYKIALKIDG